MKEPEFSILERRINNQLNYVDRVKRKVSSLNKANSLRSYLAGKGYIVELTSEIMDLNKEVYNYTIVIKRRKSA